MATLSQEDIVKICAQVIQSMNALQTKVPKFVPFEVSKETFAVYIERFENHCARNKLDDTVDISKIERKKLLLDSINTETYNLLTSLVAPQTVNEKSYSEIISILRTHLAPPLNIFLQQHKFPSTIQNNGEEIKDYVARLKTQSIVCEFYCPHSSCKNRLPTRF